jgi:RNA polymerase primary sigma factor
VDTLARRLQRTRSSAYRVLDVPARRRQGRRPGYVYHASFDDPTQEAAILAPMPGAEAYEAERRKMKPPAEVPPQLAALYTPLLSREQEQHLFRKMNFLKHKAARLRDLMLPGGRIDAGSARDRGLEAIEDLQRQARAIQDQLIHCNTRLLVSIAKRHTARATAFSDLLSDGNLALLLAVESFDYGRGNRFGTYASCVIRNYYSRSIIREKRRRKRYLTGCEEFLATAADARPDERACLASARRAADCANRLLPLLEFLDPRERQVIRLRFGLDDGARRVTLENIGKQFGVTKERVRQVQSQATKKLRNLAVASGVELP